MYIHSGCARMNWKKDKREILKADMIRKRAVDFEVKPERGSLFGGNEHLDLGFRIVLKLVKSGRAVFGSKRF